MTTFQKPQTLQNLQFEDDRTGLSIETLKRALADNLFYIQGKFPAAATPNDYYMALAYTVRDRILQRWFNTTEIYTKKGVKVVCYLSAEFLLGPHLSNNLINLGIYDQVRQAVEESGLDFVQLREIEEEPGLGNGGLGRLAACYMDSLSSLEIPAIGYGIRYEFGIFDQEIRDGWQVEITDKWLRFGNPWEIPRPEETIDVKFGGNTEAYNDEKGHYRVRWIPHNVVKGVPYDTPILGYKVNTANTLRLWKAEAPESFEFQAFNVGDYYGAVNKKVVSENITKVLYPNDELIQGKELRSTNGIQINPESLFDIQVKRLHEYKRQHLNVLYIITLYNRIKHDPSIEITPRTFIFGGKAAPGYFIAKLIIKLINSVGDVVNNDPDVRDRLKVVFLADYNVRLGQRVYPAADLSEQISTAGKEASGTGNMKFAMNGALTIGTLDGANIEIREEVGDENFFLFGLTTEEVYDLKSKGYNPWDYYNNNPQLKQAIDLINSGFFSHGDTNLFRPLVDSLLHQDQYMLFADYQSYIDTQDKVSQAYRNPEHWVRMSILNTARMGKFSSDRAIKEYCQEIWNTVPVKIELAEYVQAKAGLKV